MSPSSRFALGLVALLAPFVGACAGGCWALYSHRRLRVSEGHVRKVRARSRRAA